MTKLRSHKISKLLYRKKGQFCITFVDHTFGIIILCHKKRLWIFKTIKFFNSIIFVPWKHKCIKLLMIKLLRSLPSVRVHIYHQLLLLLYFSLSIYWFSFILTLCSYSYIPIKFELFLSPTPEVYIKTLKTIFSISIFFVKSFICKIW